MALHDLTPQLRTRLSRLERVVGLFITIATLLLLVGLAYYVYQVAQNRGWFKEKLPYYTFVQNATGLKEGDPIRLMGFEVGEIMEIEAMPPAETYLNVYIRFWVKEPYYGYLSEDSRAKVGSANFLGNRFIEATKGTNGVPTYLDYEVKLLTLREAGNLVSSNGLVIGERIFDATKSNILVRPFEALSQEALKKAASAGLDAVQIIDMKARTDAPRWMWDPKAERYTKFTGKEKGYWLQVAESPALTERLERVVNTVEAALPDFLGLTNRLARVLTNANNVVTHLDELLVSAQPVVTNFGQITANLSGPKGSLGEWLLPTNINLELQNTLISASSTLTTAQTNVNLVSSNLLQSLENVANLTSNLAAQVRANDLILSDISQLIINTDDMVQGLKRHWLLRSAFGDDTNQPVQSIIKPRIGGGK